MSENLNANAQDGEGNKNAVQGCIAVYGIIAFLLSLLIGFNMKPENPGGFVRTVLVVAAIIGGTPGGTLGGLIGDALRKIACPDMILTGGGMGQILKTKLFWAIGPQLIGTAIGTFIGVGLTAGLLVVYVFKA